MGLFYFLRESERSWKHKTWRSELVLQQQKTKSYDLLHIKILFKKYLRLHPEVRRSCIAFIGISRKKRP